MFDVPLQIYFFTNEHPLKISNKRIRISLLINQFVSLTELNVVRLINYIQNNLLKDVF